MLDEQLSKDIDEILANANIPATQASQQLPTPICPTTSLSQPLLDFSSLPPLPPSPPKLPPLNFGHWNVNDFPPMTWQHPSFAHPPPQLSSVVPDWCPYISSLMSNRIWSGKVPSFTDLSHLSDQKPATPKAEVQQELRPWTTDLILRPKRQSRFFPTSRLPQPIVKLPPTACKLHRSEQALQDPLTTAWNLSPRSTQHDVNTRGAGHVKTPAQDPPRNTDLTDVPSAANLWHILISEKLESLRPQVRGCESCWETEYDEEGGVALPVTNDEQPPPFELDGKEVPYVHTNSLTGHANDTARYHSDCTGNDNVADSAIHLAETFMSENYGLNYDLEAMPWPLFPRQPTPDVVRAKTPEMQFIDNAENVHTNTDADDLSRSTEHYKSEQALFDTKPLPSNSNEESTCDLAIFLKMGHVENCWCNECYEEPELINEEPASPIKLTEEEGWMTWDSTEDETGSVSTAPPTQINQTAEEEKDTTRHAWARAPEWDDMFPSVPKRLRVESVVESEPPQEEGEFLGYYDDGVAFARENDYDWLWNL